MRPTGDPRVGHGKLDGAAQELAALYTPAAQVAGQAGEVHARAACGLGVGGRWRMVPVGCP